MKKLWFVFAALALGAFGLAAQSALAANVKVTPLGSHDGEFCFRDRAMIFEDPDGTRILYDAGRTVRGPNDPRLGKIDAVLLSHVHADHLGDMHASSANSGPCGDPKFDVSDVPNSSSVNIVLAKKAIFALGGEMPRFFATKIKSIGGDPKLVKGVRFGGNLKVGGVNITSVPAVHSNGLDGHFVGNELGDSLVKLGLTASVGPPQGYVVRFTNGLVVYLSGDTGITAEQDLVVRQYYHANLAVINIGDVFTTGPTEAAYVIDEMVKPASVIPSHANEEATKGGKVIPGTKTDAFIKAVKVPAHLPLSGRTMEFDGSGKCRAGC